jgi:ribonuclease HI
VITAAADGSALSNPGPAGWAWYIDANRWAAGGWPHGTNNMGELMAVLDLLRQTRGVDHLHVLCDSQYAINVCTKWMAGWKSKGWRKADKKPILNLDLVQALDVELQGRKVTFEWVRGHTGHRLNEQADTLARSAAESYQRGSAPRVGPGFSPSTPRVPPATPGTTPTPPGATPPTPGAAPPPSGFAPPPPGFVPSTPGAVPPPSGAVPSSPQSTGASPLESQPSLFD